MSRRSRSRTWRSCSAARSAFDLPSVQAKLVTSGRGGYCYEHNLLFAAVLEHLRVRRHRPVGQGHHGHRQAAAAHPLCLRAEADGVPWLADVGFGGDGLLEPIAMRPGQRARQGAGAWEYALAGQGGEGT